MKEVAVEDQLIQAQDKATKYAEEIVTLRDDLHSIRCKMADFAQQADYWYHKAQRYRERLVHRILLTRELRAVIDDLQNYKP